LLLSQKKKRVHDAGYAATTDAYVTASANTIGDRSAVAASFCSNSSNVCSGVPFSYTSPNFPLLAAPMQASLMPTKRQGHIFHSFSCSFLLSFPPNLIEKARVYCLWPIAFSDLPACPQRW
jgi:hypothetical protein